MEFQMIPSGNYDAKLKIRGNELNSSTNLNLTKECDCMNGVVFNDLADYLRHGREIEFTYKGRQYSITNHSGYWYLCDDTDHILLETVCRFEDKETLVSKIAIAVIDDL